MSAAAGAADFLPASTPADAIHAFVDGSLVEWEPDDMTAYRLAYHATPHGVWLVILNLGHVIELPPECQPPEWWIPQLPRGAWAALRPLLAVHGVAEGPPVYEQADADIESLVRRTVPSAQPPAVLPDRPQCTRCVLAAQRPEEGRIDYREPAIAVYGGESLCLHHLNLVRSLPSDLPLVGRLPA